MGSCSFFLALFGKVRARGRDTRKPITDSETEKHNTAAAATKLINTLDKLQNLKLTFS